MFAWEAYEHGTDIHPQAEPTALTLMHRDFQSNKDEFKTDLKQSIIDEYGGEEHLEAPPKELLLAQTVINNNNNNYYYYYYTYFNRSIMLNIQD